MSCGGTVEKVDIDLMWGVGLTHFSYA